MIVIWFIVWLIKGTPELVLWNVWTITGLFCALASIGGSCSKS